jgi:hypothetical protein
VADHTAKPEPVLRAEARGHTPEWDPSATGIARWTCWARDEAGNACFAAVLSYNGNIYGDALTRDCVVKSAGQR